MNVSKMLDKSTRETRELIELLKEREQANSFSNKALHAGLWSAIGYAIGCAFIPIGGLIVLFGGVKGGLFLVYVIFGLILSVPVLLAFMVGKKTGICMIIFLVWIIVKYHIY